MTLKQEIMTVYQCALYIVICLVIMIFSFTGYYDNNGSQLNMILRECLVIARQENDWKVSLHFFGNMAAVKWLPLPLHYGK